MGLFSKFFKKKEEVLEDVLEEETKEEAILTLYSTTLNSKNIYEIAKKEFFEVTKSIKNTEKGIEFTFKDNTKLKLSLEDNKKSVRTQTSGMANFFSQAPLENKDVLGKALLQMQMFTCIAGIVFELNDDGQRTEGIVNTIYKIAEKTQGLLLYPTMNLYTSDGKLLISISGETDFDTYYPISDSSKLKRDVNPSHKDLDRYNKITSECDEKKIPHTDFMLGTQIMEEEVVIPSVDDIAKRAVATFSCAVYAEFLLQGGSLEQAKSEFEIINERYNVINYLTEKEKEYIKAKTPDNRASIDFSWYYEKSAVLLWALELIDLSEPTVTCDVKDMYNLLTSYNSLNDLIQVSNARSNEELLDMHTRILYYNWACVDALINKKEIPASLNPNVVQDRHYALNWLIGANGDCNWDDIQPNT